MPVGVPELLVLLVLGVSCLLPIAACVWALVILSRIRSTQDDIRQRLDGIERAMRQPPAA